MGNAKFTAETHLVTSGWDFVSVAMNVSLKLVAVLCKVGGGMRLEIGNLLFRDLKH